MQGFDSDMHACVHEFCKAAYAPCVIRSLVCTCSYDVLPGRDREATTCQTCSSALVATSRWCCSGIRQNYGESIWSIGAGCNIAAFGLGTLGITITWMVLSLSRVACSMHNGPCLSLEGFDDLHDTA